MPVAISLGYGYPQLVNCANFSPKVRPENFCIIGAKDIDKSEKDFLNRLGVRMFTLYDIERLGIARVFEEACKIISDRTDHIHVSFDIDVLDPMIAPGTGITSRGGPSYREIMYVMETLGNLQMVSSLGSVDIS